MRVRNDFVLRSIAGETLLIPVGEAAMSVKGLIALSESGLLLFELLKEGCSRQTLVERILAEYEVSVSDAEADIDAFLNQLRQLNLLVEE